MVLRCASNKRLTNVNNLCKLLRVLHFELGNIVLMNLALYHQDLLFLLLVIIKISMAFLSFPLLNFRYASYVNSTWNLKNGVFKMVVLLLYGPCGVSCKWEEYHALTTCSHVPSMVPTDPLIEYRSAHSRLTQTWGSMLYKDAAVQPQRQDAS